MYQELNYVFQQKLCKYCFFDVVKKICLGDTTVTGLQVNVHILLNSFMNPVQDSDANLQEQICREQMKNDLLMDRSPE